MTEPLLQFFASSHLPSPLRHVSLHFAQLAHTLVHTLPRNPERTVALRKLLEAKDCAVRAVLYVDPHATPSETTPGSPLVPVVADAPTTRPEAPTDG